jgi:hypothetical protein
MEAGLFETDTDTPNIRRYKPAARLVSATIVLVSFLAGLTVGLLID